MGQSRQNRFERVNLNEGSHRTVLMVFLEQPASEKEERNTEVRLV